MKAQFRSVASIVALGLLVGTSGAALADSLETQYSVYHLAAQSSPVLEQAGPAGPSRISGLQAATDWPTETQFSVYHVASLIDDVPAGQAGRAGPISVAGGSASETMYSVYDLTDRL